MHEWIEKESDDLKEELVKIRRGFHQIPEVGFEEKETSAKIADILRSYGLEVREDIAKTGIVGILRGRNAGKVIAYRADIDALPIEEKTGVEYASKNPGRMHACGHDGHITMALGTAKLLAKHKNEINGEVRFIFQPAEEGPGGAEPMINAGVLDGVNAIIGGHIWVDIPVGYIGVRSGPSFACLDRIDIKIKGKGGHGASPHQAVDALVMTCSVVNELQTIASREVDPLEPVVVTIGTIHGGYAYNIIADEIKLEGTVRALNSELRESLPQRIERIIKGVTDSMRGNYEFNYHFGYPPTVNDPTMTDFMEAIAGKVVGENKVIRVERPTMGGEDMAYYLQKVPGTYILIGTKNEDKGIINPNHNPYFNFDEDILPIGVKVFTTAILEFLDKGGAV